MRYLISSHQAYLGTPLDRLISSLKDSGIGTDEILVVVGGATRHTEQREGVEFRFVHHNSFDHTGLIEVLDSELSGDFWFALHDTCEVGPAFKEHVERLFDPSFDFTAVDQEGWTNMGVYSAKWLRDWRNFFDCMRNCTKKRAAMSERLFMRAGRTTFFTPHRERRTLATKDVYGNGVRRKTIHYSTIDLYKYQANFDKWHYNVFKP